MSFPFGGLLELPCRISFQSGRPSQSLGRAWQDQGSGQSRHPKHVPDSQLPYGSRIHRWRPFFTRHAQLSHDESAHIDVVTKAFVITTQRVLSKAGQPPTEKTMLIRRRSQSRHR